MYVGDHDEDILTQEEIDALLSAIAGVDAEDLASIDDLENFLTTRLKEFESEDSRYGIFHNDPTTVQISIGEGDVDRNLKVLREIRERNRSQGDEPIHIGATELIQYSQCPNCKKAYSRAELAQYYRNPFVPEGYTRTQIQRKDNRVHCSECGQFFTPSLVMLHKEGLGETGFLCKVQTIEAVEDFYAKDLNRKVLTRRKANIIHESRAVLLDVEAHVLAAQPSLIVNFLQYTPFKDTVRWLDPANNDRLFLFDGNLKIV